MIRAREVAAVRSWSTEHWWADVLADPRARIDAYFGRLVYLTPQSFAGRLAILRNVVKEHINDDSEGRKHLEKLIERAERVLGKRHEYIHNTWGTSPQNPPHDRLEMIPCPDRLKIFRLRNRSSMLRSAYPPGGTRWRTLPRHPRRRPDLLSPEPGPTFPHRKVGRVGGRQPVERPPILGPLELWELVGHSGTPPPPRGHLWGDCRPLPPSISDSPSYPPSKLLRDTVAAVHPSQPLNPRRDDPPLRLELADHHVYGVAGSFRRGDFADFHQRFSLVPRRCAGKYPPAVAHSTRTKLTA